MLRDRVAESSKVVLEFLRKRNSQPMWHVVFCASALVRFTWWRARPHGGRSGFLTQPCPSPLLSGPSLFARLSLCLSVCVSMRFCWSKSLPGCAPRNEHSCRTPARARQRILREEFDKCRLQHTTNQQNRPASRTMWRRRNREFADYSWHEAHQEAPGRLLLGAGTQWLNRQSGGRLRSGINAAQPPYQPWRACCRNYF